MHQRSGSLCSEHLALIFVLFFVLQPDCSVPFHFIPVVWPTKHVFGHYDHDDVFELPRNPEGGG